MKFDLIISNPPYNSNLDLKIFKEIYKLGNKFCFVHPASWLLDKKDKKKLFVDVKKLAEQSFAQYEHVENANHLFGIGNFADIYITYFDKNTNAHEDIWSISVHGNDKVAVSAKEKILNYCGASDNVLRHLKRKNDGAFEVGLSQVRGHPGTTDFYTFIQITNEDAHIGKGTIYRMKFPFITLDEAVNFKEYLKLKIARFCLSIYKLNGNLDRGELASVPYMPTYEHPWTDEQVAKELGLTEEELKWAINWIPDYYPDDKEKYKKYLDI